MVSLRRADRRPWVFTSGMEILWTRKRVLAVFHDLQKKQVIVIDDDGEAFSDESEHDDESPCPISRRAAVHWGCSVLHIRFKCNRFRTY